MPRWMLRKVLQDILAKQRAGGRPTFAKIGPPLLTGWHAIAHEWKNIRCLTAEELHRDIVYRIEQLSAAQMRVSTIYPRTGLYLIQTFRYTRAGWVCEHERQEIGKPWRPDPSSSSPYNPLDSESKSYAAVVA
jgi:hypothetical protein